MKNAFVKWIACSVMMAALCPELLNAGEIHDAIRVRDAAAALRLLAKDPETHVNALERGATPLHWASLFGLPTVVESLLKHGADVDSQIRNGSTPLHWAANRDADSIATILLHNGANLEAVTSKGQTPLHWAAIHNGSKVAALLLKAKADINAKAKDGSTPLHWAVREESFDSMSVLILAGADVFAKDSNGATPFYWIKSPEVRKKYEALIRMRQEAAATPVPLATEGRKRPVPAVARVGTGTSPKQPLPAIRKETLADDAVYDGHWKRGVMDGQGVLTYPDGESYTGAWSRGKRHGVGTQAFPDGDSYEGAWKHGLMHGEGTYALANGSRLSGTWDKGSLAKGYGSFIFAIVSLICRMSKIAKKISK